MRYSYHGIGLASVLILLASTSGFTAAPNDATPETEKAPSPQLVISFERQTMRENDGLPIRVFLSNASDKNLENVTLGWSTLPGTLLLYATTCDELKKHPTSNSPAANVVVGKLPSQQDPKSVQSLDLCLTSTTVSNGDDNLLFNLRYDWVGKEGPRHSVLTVEKSIKSAFLGADSLAGVPLALAGFIVPGLLFWLALDFWKTPWRIQGPTLGDKTVYSVLVSLLLVALVSVFPRFKEELDITQGLSLQKLEYLALLGGVAGMLIGGGDRWVRAISARRALQPTDDDLTLLMKLLRLNANRNQPKTIVRLANGQSFEGSVGAQGATHTFLVGWYRVHPNDKQQQPTEVIRAALAARDMPLAAKLVQQYHFPLDTQDFIYQQGANGAFAPTVNMRMQWGNGDVLGRPTVEVDTPNAPLRMV